MSIPDANKSGTTPDDRPNGSGKRPAVVKHLPAEPINALALLKALRRRWLAAGLLGAVAAGAAFAAVWYFLPPPQWTASAKFLMPSKPDSTLFDHPEANRDFDAFENIQVATIKSQMTLAAALRKVQPTHLKGVPKGVDELEWLEKEAHTDFPNGREILRLSISSDDQETCKTLVTALSAAYLEEIKNQTDSRRDGRLKDLEKLRENFEAKVKRLRQDVHAKAKLAGGSNDMALALRQLEAHEQAVAAQQELVGVQNNLRKLETEEALAKGRGPATVEISEAALNDFIDKRPEIAEPLKDKARLQELVASMLPIAVGREKNPDVINVLNQVEGIDKALAEKRAKLRADCEKLMREQAARAESARAGDLRRQIESAQALRDKLLKDIETLSNQAKDLNEAVLDMDDLKPELVEAEAVAARIAQEWQKLTIEKGDDPRVTAWAGEGVVVARPDEVDRKIKTGAGAAAAGFALALLLIAFLEFRARRVCAPREVEEGLGMNLVGTVPARPSLRGASRNGHWHALLAESVDSSRTMLLHGAGSAAVRVVMITSAVGGEGKTSLAGHLAVSLARSGRKSLLIDGDLRSPAVHKLFSVRPGPGFSELLRGEAQVADVLCPTAVPNLHVLTAGGCNSETLSRLAQEGAAGILAALKESFDFVIVDSSPVLPVTDALLLARHVDGVLFSVLQNVSTAPAVHEAYQRLASLDVVLLGAVVSGTRPDVSSYGRRRYLKMTAAVQGSPVNGG